MPENVVYRCNNCEFTAPQDQFLPAKDILKRHEPEDIFSDIECPKCGALAHPYKKPLKQMVISKWLSRGEAFGNVMDTVADVLEVAGRRMEKSCVSDIMGRILFQAEDGKFYAGDMVFEIYEAEDWQVADAQEAAQEEADASPPGACILTPENMHTAEDCTMHEREPAELFDVILMRKADRAVAFFAGQRLPLESSNDALSARRRKLSAQTAYPAELFSVFIVESGKYIQGDILPDDFIQFA